MTARSRRPSDFSNRHRGDAEAIPSSVRAAPGGAGAALADLAIGLREDSAAERARAWDALAPAWQVRVVVNLGAPEGGRIAWRRGPLPTVRNIEAALTAHPFRGLDARLLLYNDSAATALERGDGNWETAVRALADPGLRASLADLTAAFNVHVWPARTRPTTRAKNWANWVTVLTWAIARQATALIMPMHVDTLKALTWDLITFGSSRSQLAAVWAAVQARHRSFALPAPIQGPGEFSAWLRSIGCIMGRPLKLKFPVHKGVVRWLLRWRPDSVAANRDRLLTALATIACLRVSEVARLQSCDLWFDHFTGYGVGGFDGTCAVHVALRKNDSERKGHLPGLGCAHDPELDIVYQLQRWLDTMGLRPDRACLKRLRPAARCPLCPPLFPGTTKGPGYTTVASSKPLSAQQVSQAIRDSVTRAGCDPTRFSGISARKGGLSTAIEAGVSGEVLYLQSGHGHDRAAMHYIHLLGPDRLLETFRAFEL